MPSVSRPAADRHGHRLLVVGAGPDAVRLALELADAGLAVTLATAGALGPLAGGARGSTLYDEVPLLVALRNHPRVELLEQAAVRELALGEDGLGATLRLRPQPVDPARCTACGKCVPVCPVDLPAAGGLPARAPVTLAPADLGPAAARIEKEGRAPCRAACPIGVNAQGYVALVAKGRHREALALVRERNPLPGICGRVCTHPCESACRRGEIDEPVAICRIKRFAADVELAEGEAFAYPPPAAERAERVAVVGSGPAGLTAAFDLRRLGYRVTVFEALPAAGGLLRWGIPAYRLPREILDREIALLAATGIEIRTGVRVGAGVTVEGLQSEGFAAVVVATGSPKDRAAGLPGEQLPGVHGCLSFLKAVNLGAPPPVGRRVAVIGGGNAAIDAARTAVRLGAHAVTVVYRRGEAEMPALPEEVAAAREEGVAFRFLESPIAFAGGSAGVSAVRCVAMALGAPDASGRRRPEPVAGSEHDLPAETVILAIGQEGDGAALAGAAGVAHAGGRIVADGRLATGRPGVFAAGDAARGPASVIEAMADGQRAALAAHAFVSGEAVAWPDWSRTDYDRGVPPRDGYPRAERLDIPHLAAKRRRSTLDEVDLAYREADARAEAARCLQCGACCECGACVRACGEAAAIDHAPVVEERSLALLGALRTDAGEPIGAGAAHLLHDAAGGGRLPAAAEIVARFREELRPLGPGRRVPVEGSAGPRVGAFLCSCNGSVRHLGLLDALAGELRDLPGVAHVAVVNAACQGGGAALIAPGLRAGAYDRVLLAACLCCPLEIVCGSCSHQRARAKGFLYGGQEVPLHRLETVNLRDEVLNQERLGAGEAHRLASRLLRTALARSLAAVPEAREGAETATSVRGDDRPAPLPLPGCSIAAARIDAGLCRGCGTCFRNCPQAAIEMRPRAGGVPVAHVLAGACTLCGRCLAACPTGAPDAPFAGHRQIREALAAALAGGAR